MQFPQHRSRRLDQRRNGKCLVQPHRNVAYPYFQSLEEWMWPDVPPDFLAVIDAVRLDQQIDERFVIRPVREHVRDARTREALKDLRAVRLEASFHPQPERRIRRQ